MERKRRFPCINEVFSDDLYFNLGLLSILISSFVVFFLLLSVPSIYDKVSIEVDRVAIQSMTYKKNSDKIWQMILSLPSKDFPASLFFSRNKRNPWSYDICKGNLI